VAARPPATDKQPPEKKSPATPKKKRGGLRALRHRVIQGFGALLSVRVLRALRRRIPDMLALARAEARRDLGRLLVALALLGAGLMLFASAALMLNVAAVMGLMERTYVQSDAPGLYASLTVAGVDATLGVLLAAIAAATARRPALKKSRAELDKTVDSLKMILGS